MATSYKRRPATYDDLGRMFDQLRNGKPTEPKVMHDCGLEICADPLTPGLFFCDSPAHPQKGWMLPMAGVNHADKGLYVLQGVHAACEHGVPCDGGDCKSLSGWLKGLHDMEAVHLAKCQCGSAAVGAPRHSSYCPKYQP